MGRAITLEAMVGWIVELEPEAGELVGLCPFHAEAEEAAVLRVNAAKQTWRCSSCALEDQSIVEWVMKAEGVPRAHASELICEGALAQKAGRSAGGPLKGKIPMTSTIRRLRSPFSADDTDEQILEKVVAYYARELPGYPPAIACLEERQIERRAVEAFEIGIANRTLGLRLPSKNRLKGKEQRARLTALGILRESGHEQLRGSIVVPLRDETGRIVNLYGRKIEKRYGGEHFFTDASRKGIFNARGLAGATEIVIAASVLDALSLWSIGCTRVTSFHGADGPLDEVLAAVSKSGARRVTLVVRRTAELEKAVLCLVDEIAAMGIEVLRARLPGAEDANDVLRGRDGRYKLGQLVRAAEWVAGVPGGATPGRRAPAQSAPATPAAAAAPDAGDGASTGQPEGQREASHGADEAGEVYRFEDRRWRVRGLDENLARGTLRLNVFVGRDEGGFHVDSFDLYSARHRAAFVHQAACELGMEEASLKRELGQVLLRVEQAQEEMLVRLREPQTKLPEMSAAERQEALELLREPDLVERVLGAFATMGIVGERDNLLLGYLVALSRKIARPLAMVIQSSSAAGKTAVLEAVLSTVPEEDRSSYSAISGQSLYYMRPGSLRQRVLSIAEEVGVQKATYAMKLLQSSKELRIASTGKDGTSGRITCHEYKVEGPIALMITTSKVELDEELVGRCLVVTIDESPEQTKAVQEAQRREQSLEGIVQAERRARLEKLHQNMQRLLRPVLVVNPFADEIAFEDRRVRARRDHRKLLSLIETIALLHQHQRELRKHEVTGERVVEYIEATKEDVELAERLMVAALGKGADDLPPRTAELLDALAAYVDARAIERRVAGPLTFSRRQAREALGWGDTQLKTHLRRLVEAELVIVHRAAHGRGVAYELAVDARRADRAGVGRPSVGPRSGVGRPLDLEDKPSQPNENSSDPPAHVEISRPGVTATAPSVAIPKAS